MVTDDTSQLGHPDFFLKTSVRHGVENTSGSAAVVVLANA